MQLAYARLAFSVPKLFWYRDQSQCPFLREMSSFTRKCLLLLENVYFYQKMSIFTGKCIFYGKMDIIRENVYFTGKCLFYLKVSIFMANYLFFRYWKASHKNVVTGTGTGKIFIPGKNPISEPIRESRICLGCSGSLPLIRLNKIVMIFL